MDDTTRKATILNVDDDEGGRYAVTRVLRHAGYEVVEAGSGEGALEAARETRPDLIVLDVNMPGMSGFEVVRLLRAEAATASIPVLHVSATARGSDSVIAGLDGGADGYLTQPLDPRVLLATVGALLRARRAEEQLIAAERARAELAEHLTNEIAHRVKNDIAMVAGLLQMQALTVGDARVSGLLRDAIARLRTFGQIHELMYAAQRQEADLLEVVRRIAANARELFGDRVEITVEGEPCVYGASHATNLAVAANELITNALKHGGPDEGGLRRVAIRVGSEGGRFRLSVWNSGKPVPEGFDATGQQGMGLRLVWDLMSQYGGSFRLRPGEGGSAAEVEVPEEGLRG